MARISQTSRRACLLLVRVYQYLISPILGPSCRFYPTCSSYAHESIEKFGVFRGSMLTLRRLGKCHPWHPGGYDPVPESPQTK